MRVRRWTAELTKKGEQINPGDIKRRHTRRQYRNRPENNIPHIRMVRAQNDRLFTEITAGQRNPSQRQSTY